jgi:hydroxypyruvate isomerase
MPRFSANLSMLFTEVDFLERFRKAAQVSFKGVEYLFPYAWKAEQLREQLDRNGLVQVLHNLPAGDWEAGERGIACIPGREAEFREGVGRAVAYAKILGCTRLNCLVGKTPEAPPGKIRETLVANLRYAAEALAQEKITLLIEPLNSVDIPGFHLVTTADTLGLFDEIGHPNLRLQYDVYHMKIMEGNPASALRRHAGRIGHIQIADVPGRHEPGTGTIDFPGLFRAVDQSGYNGWIGCEYKPSTAATEGSLAWLRAYIS